MLCESVCLEHGFDGLLSRLSDKGRSCVNSLALPSTICPEKKSKESGLSDTVLIVTENGTCQAAFLAGQPDTAASAPSA